MARLRRGWVGYLFASPWLVGFFALTLVPIVASLLLSLLKWNGMTLGTWEWVGLDNYTRAIQHDKFVGKALWNTVYYSFLAVPLGLTVSLGLAVLLNQKIRGINFFRTIFYMPHVIGGVATIMMWIWVFNPDFGVLNSILRAAASVLQAVGLVSKSWQPPTWLNDPQWAKPSLIIMSVWGAGGAMLIFLAALQNVPQQLYEAAQIDGAGKWAMFTNVTWPQLAPTTFFIVVMSCIGGLQGGFQQARVMTQGGPAGTTTTLAYYIYTKAFEEFQIGYASAVAWVLFSIIFVVTMVNWKFGAKELSY